MRPWHPLFVALLSTLGLVAEPPTEWKQGKLIDLTTGTVSRVVGINGNVTTKHRKLFIFSVDGGDKVYEAEEVARKAPHVEVNAAIEYSVSKDYLYVRDIDGKAHKLALLKTTRQK